MRLPDSWPPAMCWKACSKTAVSLDPDSSVARTGFSSRILTGRPTEVAAGYRCKSSSVPSNVLPKQGWNTLKTSLAWPVSALHADCIMPKSMWACCQQPASSFVAERSSAPAATEPPGSEVRNRRTSLASSSLASLARNQEARTEMPTAAATAATVSIAGDAAATLAEAVTLAAKSLQQDTLWVTPSSTAALFSSRCPLVSLIRSRTSGSRTTARPMKKLRNAA
mmetsp:Transcript_21453/g.30291  ORF Transcript_21453/g.30291 Transcript_21453/m.30291 type:complete len:224 (-) Transcript_21453:2553-3224(-)